jgi:3-isopropylmalate/(R)-2-methylmalate dehydratase large subunit
MRGPLFIGGMRRASPSVDGPFGLLSRAGQSSHRCTVMTTFRSDRFDNTLDAQRQSHPRVRIFDTTLRDGEQAPGCTMSLAQKLTVAHQLAQLGVDVIEAGFPASSHGEVAAVQAIARAVGTPDGPIICGLARADPRDIDWCAEAIAPAARTRIHTFLATSDIHLEHKLKLTRAQVLERVNRAVRQARAIVSDVEFSPEDATRSDADFLDEVLQVAIDAGATTLNIPDTVGYHTPHEYAALIERVIALAARYDGIVVSTHCHDDLGLAVANSLAGVRAGARQVECTINGIGERAGNAALEEIVMALKARTDVFGVHTGIATTELVRASQCVASCTEVKPSANKAIVGANAFAHEAGIHQDGVIKHRATYEIMTPESVGFDGHAIVLGKHSGRRALRVRLEALGHVVDEATFERIFWRFKELADRQKRIEDHELSGMVKTQQGSGARTLFDKVWDEHIVTPQTDATPAILYIDLHLVHEVTSPQAFAELRARGLSVRRPRQTFATMDHSTPTTPRAATDRGLPVMDDEGRHQLEELERNCQDFDVPLYPLGHDRQGIVHVIGPELGLTQPGFTIVCGDSHTSTHGAFGALAFGIGTSQVAHVLATQCLLQTKPKTMSVRIDGALNAGVTAKDVILALISKIGIAGATGHVIEYRGSTIERMSMDERMTICNMSIEAGARAGMIAPDDTTIEYLRGRPFAPSGRSWDEAVTRWRALASDDGARFDKEVTLAASALEPMITYGTNPGMGMPITGTITHSIAYMGFAAGAPIVGTKVDVVFVGSCTNARLSDLREAATLMRGRRVASGVRMLVVPGSRRVKEDAEAEGLHDVFRSAGAEWREAGCSMCIAMNGDMLAPGQVAVSTSNRNFEGRQGKGGRTLLASPITAAAAALTGVVTDPRTITPEVA